MSQRVPKLCLLENPDFLGASLTASHFDGAAGFRWQMVGLTREAMLSIHQQGLMKDTKSSGHTVSATVDVTKPVVVSLDVDGRASCLSGIDRIESALRMGLSEIPSVFGIHRDIDISDFLIHFTMIDNSLGNPVAIDQSGHDNFVRWFGQSQLVDLSGRPRVFYRGEGSREDFEKFKRSMTRENAFFFTESFEIASDYANGSTPRAFYLRANNVLDLTRDTVEAEGFVRKWAKFWDKDGWVDRTSGEEVDPVDVVFSGRLFDYEGTWSQERWLDLQAAIRDSEYDGAFLPDSHSRMDMTSVIVFDPDQIKSVDNSGEFSPGSSSIYDR